MKKRSVVLIHVLYWSFALVSILMFSSFTKFYSQELKDFSLINFWLNRLSNVLAFYIGYLFLFPKLLPQKKYAKFFLASAISLVVITAITYGAFKLSMYWYLSSQGLTSSNIFRQYGYNPLYTYSSGVFVGLVNGSLLRGFISWYTESRAKDHLKRKNIQTELALLRARINPHFLFNTLNNIDILISKDPQTASLYLNKLSDIMRFTIYESSAEKIALEQELEYIQKYIELQRIRTTNSNFVNYAFSGDPGRLNIAPMLFIPFIENAFKHATDKKVENAIDISISVKDSEIRFTCSNVIDTAPAFDKQKGGIGMELIQNRLDLMYPNHKLEIQKSDMQYHVNLSLNLSED